MAIIAVLIALRLVMQLISVPIPAVTQTISLSWVPLMIMGWYFGPIYGFLLGAVCDTLSYFIFSGGVWFWMYAIQEPLVAVILGIFGGVCRLRRSKVNANMVNDVIAQQLIYAIFAVASYVIVILWLTKDRSIPSYQSHAYVIYKYLSLSLITTFFIAMEFFGFYNIIHRKENKFKTITFIYASSAVVVVMLIFSFALGPISTVAYYKYLHNGKEPSSWLQYGAVYYLIPRLIVQSIKVPIEATLLTSLVFVLDPKIDRMLLNINNRW